MKRRAALAALPTLALAGCVESATEFIEDTDDTPMNQRLHGDFTRIEFSTDGTAALYFKEDHECSGFAIAHQADTDLSEHSLMMCAAPRFSGPIEFNILNQITAENAAFPDNGFQAIGLEGTFGDCDQQFSFDFYGDRTSDSNFRVPESIWNQRNATQTSTDDSVEI